MKYRKVAIEAIGYELAPVVVSSEELEERLEPMYRALHIAPVQLEALTGIRERRWWEEGYPVSHGALAAARKALAASGIEPNLLGTLIYAGVCRDAFEPATACAVANGLGVDPSAAVYDVSNACLGVLNGMIDIANRIELGHSLAGLVVSCESARDINEVAIARMLQAPRMDVFASSLATLTGGSGAVAVLLTDGSLGRRRSRRLLGGVTEVAPEHHLLCRWGLETSPAGLRQYMRTDAPAVREHGIELGARTWRHFLDELGWSADAVRKVICHQVGAGHQDAMLKKLGIDPARDFTSFPYLGNMGTVSLPLTAALAEQRGFLQPGERVGWLGIGSGLNCLMLGVEW